jgi:GMP synthase (glutamine-hydrolysing)
VVFVSLTLEMLKGRVRATKHILKMNTKTQIIIVDYGSQYTNVIARLVTELGYYCKIVDWTKANGWLAQFQNNPKLVILSGSDKSVYKEGAPTLPAYLDLTGTTYHILGICYGMQLIAHKLGGNVRSIPEKKEYGKTHIDTKEHFIFKGTSLHEYQDVWMSHGDSVTAVPDGYKIIAESKAIAAMAKDDSTIVCLQFHPEVSHTQKGAVMLKNMIEKSGCTVDWKITDHISIIREETQKAVDDLKKNGIKKPKAVLGLSGGVDSAVAAAAVLPVFGKENLHCIIIDHGALRKDDLEIAKQTAEIIGVSYEVIDASETFLEKMMYIRPNASIEHSELVRAVFSKGVYQGIFDKKAKEVGAHFIIQGTNAADLTESGKLGGAALIKTHHNTGLKFSVTELMPLGMLYKYQIRAIGKELGLPKAIWNRQPFPGPGLYLRLVDMQITREDLGILQEADYTARQIWEKHDLMEHISQSVIAMFGTRAVGIKADERVYNRIISLRPVASSDFMTVTGYRLPREVEEETEAEICKHPSISKVVWDYMSKPPSTTEYQ